MTTDFAVSVLAALAEGRAIAESLMTDTCTITRAGTGGAGAFDTVTGLYATPSRTTIYTGKCRVQVKAVVATSANPDAGERLATNQEHELQLPIEGTDTITVGDVAHLDTAVSDSSLVGRVFTVTARHEKSQATARRLRVTEGTA